MVVVAAVAVAAAEAEAVVVASGVKIIISTMRMDGLTLMLAAILVFPLARIL